MLHIIEPFHLSLCAQNVIRIIDAARISFDAESFQLKLFIWTVASFHFHPFVGFSSVEMFVHCAVWKRINAIGFFDHCHHLCNVFRSRENRQHTSYEQIIKYKSAIRATANTQTETIYKRFYVFFSAENRYDFEFWFYYYLDINGFRWVCVPLCLVLSKTREHNTILLR